MGLNATKYEKHRQQYLHFLAEVESQIRLPSLDKKELIRFTRTNPAVIISEFDSILLQFIKKD